MFSSALRSLTTGITANYTIDAQPFSASGPWLIFNAKQKTTSKPASVFIFETKSLASSAAHLGPRASAASTKALQQEVTERLRSEASALAKLRHPSILELAEPVEDTRNGGLIFVTEPILAPLSKLLEVKAAGCAAGKSRSSVARSTPDDYELNELEIQKGLLQLGKGLEFLHDSAGLVHANLHPGAIYVTAKSDWKIAGFGFTGPAADSTKPTSLPSLSLSQALRHDPRLPATVQLNLDYTSPDFVLDDKLKSSSDMFSLGLLIVGLYGPCKSPIDTNGSVAAYKRIFSAPSTIPRQANNFLSSVALPPQLLSDVLPKLITRHAETRLTASAFGQVAYFNSVLVSSIRFLDALQGKVHAEKIQFLQGFPQVVPQFPKSVLQRKVMPILLEQMQHQDVLVPLLQCIFAAMAQIGPDETAGAQVAPRLRDMFATAGADKTALSEDKKAGLKIIMDNLGVLAAGTADASYREDVLPIFGLALRSTLPPLVDSALSSLPAIMSKLDYSTLKNGVFPLVAHVFASTKSLGIKVRALESFDLLCGGSDTTGLVGDGLDGVVNHRPEKTQSLTLDKFVVQEKLVPLVKAIKTKEPNVMMAALRVLKQVVRIADHEFVALQVLPILWTFALSSLLDLSQFQTYMELIKAVTAKIERQQTSLLQDTTSHTAWQGSNTAARTVQASTVAWQQNTGEDAFVNLVTGRPAGPSPTDMISDWTSNDTTRRPQAVTSPLSFTSPPSAGSNLSYMSAMSTQNGKRSVTPDSNLNAYATLQPQTMFSQPLQPTTSLRASPSLPVRSSPQLSTSSFSILPPPGSRNGSLQNMAAPTFNAARPASSQGTTGQTMVQQQSTKTSLDKYESLI